MKEKSFISAVIYVYNRENLIEEYLNRITAYFDSNFEKFELVLVNDASTDNTYTILKSFEKKSDANCMISILNLSYYQGREKAILAGNNYAIGDFIFEFDDVVLDYDVDVIMDVYNKSMEGYDIVSATSDAPIPLSSRIFYKIYNASAKNKTNLLQHETFRVISRRAYNRVKSLNHYITYRKSAYITAGLPIASVNYNAKKVEKREYTKDENIHRGAIAIDTLILYTDAVTNFLLKLSMFFLAFALLVGLYTVVIYCFMDTKPVEGWAPIMGLLSAGLAGLFSIMFLIIKYLHLLLRGIYTKVDYVFQSIEKL